MDNEIAKISVIIPTFNREKLVVDAINSLKNQTYKNLEIIVVDDCSTDNTRVQVEKIIDPRIVYIRHDKNNGAPKARNTGIQKASGEFIAFLDSDDQWLPAKLEKQMAVFKKNQKAAVVYTGVKNTSGTILRSETIPQFRGNILTELLKSNCVGTTSTVVIRKTCLLEAGGFDPKLPSCQDWDLWIKLAQITEFDFVEEALVLFNEHDGDRITTNFNSVVTGHLAFYEKYYSLIKSLNKKDLHLSHVNIARILIRTGIMDQNRVTIKKGRDFLHSALRAYPFSIKIYGMYLGTYLNKKMLLKLYSFFRKNTSPFMVANHQPGIQKRPTKVMDHNR